MHRLHIYEKKQLYPNYDRKEGSAARCQVDVGVEQVLV